MQAGEKTWLDFVIIGAQKCGTTTIFRLLAEHPAIVLPPEKESAFFSRDEYVTKGWTWFLRGTFGNAPQDKLWGKASPQYMSYPQVPERMARQLPRVKCIAILRDPVNRAYSHYRMSVRRGWEKRSFEECVRAQLAPAALEESRLNPTEVNSYVIYGEFGRILSAYVRHFPRDQLLVLFTKDLANDPEGLVVRIFDFLGVEPYVTETLGQSFHQGGTRTKLPIVAEFLGAFPVQSIRRRFPLGLWRRLERWYLSFEQWNMIPDRAKGIPLTSQTLTALQEHFEADATTLEETLEVSPPWLPFAKPNGIQLALTENDLELDPKDESEGRGD